MLADVRTAAAVLAALLACPISAKTDLEGCVSSETVKYGGASLIWYVPDTGEVCEFLDCGGGRAPPKTTVPGCAAYSGTATYSPSYLTGYGSVAVSTSTAAPSASAAGSATSASPTITIPASLTTAAVGSSNHSTTSNTLVSNASGANESAGSSAVSQSAASSAVSHSAASSSTAASSVSKAAGAIATSGPVGMLVGLAVGAAAML